MVVGGDWRQDNTSISRTKKSASTYGVMSYPPNSPAPPRSHSHKMFTVQLRILTICDYESNYWATVG